MQGDWRAWLDGAKTDLDAGLKALESAPESALLVDWAKAYGPQLVERVQQLDRGVHLLDRAVEAWDEVRCVAKGGESEVALITLMERTKMRMDEARDFLRGVGRD